MTKIITGSRVVVVSGQYGVGHHGVVKYLKHAGPEKWQQGALVEIDNGWFPEVHLRERRDEDRYTWFPLCDLKNEKDITS